MPCDRGEREKSKWRMDGWLEGEMEGGMEIHVHRGRAVDGGREGDTRNRGRVDGGREIWEGGGEMEGGRFGRVGWRYTQWRVGGWREGDLEGYGERSRVGNMYMVGWVDGGRGWEGELRGWIEGEQEGAMELWEGGWIR